LKPISDRVSGENSEIIFEFTTPYERAEYVPSAVFHGANFSKHPKVRKMSKKKFQCLKEVDFNHFSPVFRSPATNSSKKLSIWSMRLRGLPES